MIFKLIDVLLVCWGSLAYRLYHIFGWKFVYLVGAGVSFFKQIADGAKHRLLKDEIQGLFGNRHSPHEIDQIVKRSFDIYYKRQVETFFLGALDKRTINAILAVDGLEHVDIALKAGKGIILLLSHFGSFLLPLPFFGFNNYKINQITGNQIPSSAIADRMWLWRKREAERLPVSYIPADGFLRPVFNALKNNEIVAIAFDGRDGTKWVEVDFLNKTALFSPGPFDIARRTGAAIIPTFVKRINRKKHRMILYPRFELSKASQKEEAIQNDTARFAKLFEKYVSEYPCHFGKILYNYKMQRILGTANPFYAEVK